MKSSSPALTQASLVSTAGRKAQKVQRKLQHAEAELNTANKTLVKAVPRHNEQEINSAVKQNVAAEEKVHEAAEELHVVRELLSEAEADGRANEKAISRSAGQTGNGVKSLIPHLERRRSAASE